VRLGRRNARLSIPLYGFKSFEYIEREIGYVNFQFHCMDSTSGGRATRSSRAF
jgi:hypothetical protein